MDKIIIKIAHSEYSFLKPFILTLKDKYLLLLLITLEASLSVRNNLIKLNFRKSQQAFKQKVRINHYSERKNTLN